MIRHLFRLAWNQRRANGLILFEVLVCFLVLCALLTGVAFLAGAWIRPLGFDYHNVFVVRAERPQREEDRLLGDTVTPATIARLLKEVQALPDVESAALSSNTPWSGGESTNSAFIDGHPVSVLFTPTTAGLPDVLDLKIVRGRWFDESDVASGWRPAVLTENLVRGYFGNEDPLGKSVPEFDENGQRTAPGASGPEYRIVGVISDYRRNGDFSLSGYAMFLPGRFDSLKFSTPEELLIRLRPGTPPATEERILKTLRGVEPNWSYTIDPLSRLRERRLREFLIPVVALAMIAGFLVLMVGLGLLGVLWQGVVRRTAEFGVRRALGATQGGILRQILGEIAAIATIAVAAGTLLFLQLPLLHAVPFLTPGTYLVGLVGAVAMIYCLVLLCGLYPGWLATRVEPALALKHE